MRVRVPLAALQKWKEVRLKLSYIIANDKIGIKIQQGKVVTCDRKDAQIFPEAKAQNIFRALPKIYQKFHMKVIPAGQIPVKPGEQEPTKVVYTDKEELPEKIQKWVDRVQGLNGLGDELKERERKLLIDLSEIDRKVSNVYHDIEFVQKPNACVGYKLFRELKDVLEQRRLIKDELAMVQHLSTVTLQSYNHQDLDQFIEKMKHRKFYYR